MRTTGTFRVGERVATSRGFVAEIVRLADGLALIRYLGNRLNLGEIELPIELLRAAMPGDLLLAGIDAVGARACSAGSEGKSRLSHHRTASRSIHGERVLSAPARRRRREP